MLCPSGFDYLACGFSFPMELNSWVDDRALKGMAMLCSRPLRCAAFRSLSSTARDLERAQPCGGDEVGDFVAGVLGIGGDEDVQRLSCDFAGDEGPGEGSVECFHDSGSREFPDSGSVDRGVSEFVD